MSTKLRLWRGVGRLLDGFSTITGSNYLTWLTVYIMLNTTISSMMYFEKSMVRLPCLLALQEMPLLRSQACFSLGMLLLISTG